MDVLAMDWKEKSKLDQSYEKAHLRILQAQKDKNDLLVKMGQFAKNDEKWDAQESVKIIMKVFLGIAESTLSKKMYDKLEKELIRQTEGKDIKELNTII